MKVKDAALSIVKTLVQAGHTTYFAGGWVRDHLMKHPSDDIDIATSASIQEIQELFPKNIPVGVNFGIVIVPYEGFQFEVATFRIDIEYKDGRRPVGIKHASPEEDAKRRDFTINGMFYDPLQNQLYDYVGGKEDLKKGIIRAIGDPHQRFEEDRLRMMRAVRYSSRFQFPIEPKTLQAIEKHATELLPAVAVERIWQEFQKMAKFAQFDKGLILMHELGLLAVIFPSLKSVSLPEIKKRVKYIEQFPKKAPCIAQLLELFPTISRDEIEEFCIFLKLSYEEKEFADFLIHTRALFQMPSSWLDNLEPIEWVQFYAHKHAETCLHITSLHLSESEKFTFLKQHTDRIALFQNAIKRIIDKQPVVRAADLIALGIKPGEKMGILLREAERISVNEQLEDKKEILTRLQQSSLW